MLRLLFFLLIGCNLHAQQISAAFESAALRDLSLIQQTIHPLFGTKSQSTTHVFQLHTNHKIHLPNIGPHSIVYTYAQPNFSLGNRISTAGNTDFNTISYALQASLNIQHHTLGVYIKYIRAVLDIHRGFGLAYGLYGELFILPSLSLQAILANPAPTPMIWSDRPRHDIPSELHLSTRYALNRNWQMIGTLYSNFSQSFTFQIGLDYTPLKQIHVFALVTPSLSRISYGGIWKTSILNISLSFWRDNLLGLESIISASTWVK